MCQSVYLPRTSDCQSYIYVTWYKLYRRHLQRQKCDVGIYLYRLMVRRYNGFYRLTISWCIGVVVQCKLECDHLNFPLSYHACVCTQFFFQSFSNQCVSVCGNDLAINLHIKCKLDYSMCVSILDSEPQIIVIKLRMLPGSIASHVVPPFSPSLPESLTHKHLFILDK